MADVFISYHRSEGASALVRRIAAELENRDVSCWYDTKNKAPVDFIHLILTEISACKVFLFLWDEESNKETFYVRREIHTAATDGNIKLFPFRVGDFEMNPVLKFYFCPINILYGGDSPETARIEELVEVIADILGKEPAPQQKRETSAPPPLFPPPKIVKQGKCGASVNFALDENGILAISGAGLMQDFEWDGEKCNTSWWNERETISHVEIQDGVTSIGNGSFYGCMESTNVSIPDSVAYIGEFAFAYCTGLTSIIIPDSVTNIKNLTFFCCTGLKSVTIPNSVITIGEESFAYCAGLTSVTIPDSVIEIEWNAFGGCDKLTSVSVPAKTAIHPEAFPDTVRITRRE